MLHLIVYLFRVWIRRLLSFQLLHLAKSPLYELRVAA